MTTNLKTVLITGASSGIGLDVARGFLEKGSNVVLNAAIMKSLRPPPKHWAITAELPLYQAISVIEKPAKRSSTRRLNDSVAPMCLSIMQGYLD